MSSAGGAHARGGCGARALRVRVRDATRGDVPHVLRMIQELAEYEGVPDGPQLSAEASSVYAYVTNGGPDFCHNQVIIRSLNYLIEDAFDTSPPWCFILVAELVVAGAGEGAGDGAGAGAAGGLAGYALCNRAYSSWTRRALYVEDLYVRAEMRGGGVGTELLARLCQMGVSEGVQRIDWHVLESNSSARAFYSRLGARCLRESEGRAALRLDAPHIARLAHAPGHADRRHSTE